VRAAKERVEEEPEELEETEESRLQRRFWREADDELLIDGKAWLLGY